MAVPAVPSQSQAVVSPRPAKEGYKPTPEQLTKINKVKERVNFQTRESGRMALERQIFECIAFYCGIQWLEYSEATKRLQRWNAPSWFPTPVTNLIAPRVQVMASHLTRSRPQGRIRPVSNEPADREAAKVGEKLLTHLYQVTKEEKIRTRAALIAALTGTVIAEDHFNPRAGKPLKVPRTQLIEKPVVDIGPMGEEMPKMWPDGRPITEQKEEDVLDENGQPIVDEFREGEIESRVRPLFNFYWDPKATELEEARWCGEVSYMDLGWIDENFPELGPYVQSEEGVDGMNFFESSLLALVGPSIQGTAHAGGTQYYTNGAAVRKYFERPTLEFPNGQWLVVAGDVLLYEGDLPIKDEQGNVTGDFPYTEFRYDEVPGRFAGRTPTEDMVPAQKRVNGIDAQVILNRKTLLNPWVLAPKGSGLDPGRVAMRPGATVLYNFIGVGAAPQVVHGVPLPQQVMEEREQAIMAMDNLVQDAGPQAQQTLPPGVKSGIALNFMRELQQEQLMPRLNRWGQWIAERDRKRLLLAQQHYREERAIKLLGVGSDWQVQYWKGADLRGNTDVTIDQGSLIPKAESVKTQTMFDGVENLLINPQDPLQRQKMIERLGLTEFETEVGPDQRRAEKENAQMDDGMPVELTQYEDKQLHLMTHIKRVKDPSFDSLAPEIQQVHLQHIMMTEQAIQQEALQAQMQAETDMQRKLVMAERAQAVGVDIGALENPQEMSNPGGGEETAA